MLALIGGVVAFALGRYGEAAKDAHGRFVSYRGRTVAAFRTWIKDVVTVTLLIGGIALAILLLLR
ncbi:hypothetical protein [Nonomuraea rosea]|uniref:hypothetical protein n=1 Tax=Nonomuraea rosea TaxID=638574 RepID=UPI0031E6B9FF